MSTSPSPSSSPPPVPPPATQPNSTSNPPPQPVSPPATQPNSTSNPTPPTVPPPATQPNSTSTPPPTVPPPATLPNSTSTPAPPPSTTTASPPPPSATPPSPNPDSLPPASSPPPPATPVVPPPASSAPPTVPSSPPLLPPPPLARPPSRSPPSQPRSPAPSPPPTIQPVAPPPPPPTRDSSVPASPTLPLPAPTRPSSNPSPNNPSDSPGTAASDVASGGGSGIGTGGLVVTISVVAVAALLLLIVGIICVLRRRKKREAWDGNGYVIPSPYGSSNMSDSSLMKSPASGAALVGKSFSMTGNPCSPSDQGGLGNSRSWFTYEELLQVTSSFSEYNLLGQGGFGPVYKGRLPDGREVAVKQLKDGGNQGEREFRAEVEIISRIHHRHLVSLVGYCIHENQRLLVYDYVPNNTLHYHLHGRKQSVMDWATRVKIAAGAAKGIAYLHEDCHPRIIHRDIKSSNILLDNNFEAQVSDFGLAKLALDTFTHVSTRVMGTFGYLAPEYASSGKLTEKSDVYSFGVVLLELITGRKPVDTTQPLGDESLVEWARPLLSQALESRNVESLVNPKLGRNYVEPEMLRMIEAAAACVRHSAAKRPRMGQVMRALDSITDLLDLNNGIRPGESEFFDSAQQSDIRIFQRMAFGSHEFDSDFSQASWRTNSREV